MTATESDFILLSLLTILWF